MHLNLIGAAGLLATAAATVTFAIARSRKHAAESVWQLLAALAATTPARASQEGEQEMNIDHKKAVTGFAMLFMGLAEHAPELAHAALASYADVQSGNPLQAATDAGEALPVLAEIAKEAVAPPCAPSVTP